MQSDFTNVRGKTMEADRHRDLVIYDPQDHLQCAWRTGEHGISDLRCRMPASVPQRKVMRAVSGRENPVWVDLGHCGYHHDCIENGDVKAGDQMLLRWERHGYPEIPEANGRDTARYEHALAYPSVAMSVALDLAKAKTPEERIELLEQLRFALREAKLRIGRVPYVRQRRARA